MATQKDLAKLAGVSSGTVSNVISGTVPVSKKARKKVLDAIRTLNYQPNLIARSLKTNRTNTLGIVVPDITIPFFPKVIRGAEAAARERGYFVLVLDSQGSHDLEKEMLALLRQRVDGILLVTSGNHPWSQADVDTVKAGPPLVCVDRVPDGLENDYVCVDNVGAAEMGIAHLLSVGHRNIAIVTGPLSLKNEQKRLQGYRQAMQLAAVPIQEPLIWSSSFDPQEIQEICQKGLLRSRVKPTAIFATNGLTGSFVLRSTMALGLSTPTNFGFATIDEIASEDFLYPRITTVVQPCDEIGRHAIEVIIERIQEGNTEHKPAGIQLHATLVVRDTSGLIRNIG